jgi:hypothetical protein
MENQPEPTSRIGKVLSPLTRLSTEFIDGWNVMRAGTWIPEHTRQQLSESLPPQSYTVQKTRIVLHDQSGTNPQILEQIEKAHNQSLEEAEVTRENWDRLTSVTNLPDAAYALGGASHFIFGVPVDVLKAQLSSLHETQS